MEQPIPGGGGGLGLDGGMAEYMLVPFERLLVKLPGTLSPADAAPLTDAGLTPYHAVRRSMAKMLPESFVVIIGVGGLGHMGVQFVKALTAARIIAVDMKQEALNLATKVGADFTVKSDADAVAKIREITGGIGADVVLDFVGAEATIKTAMGSARSLADVTIVGIAGGTFPFNFFSQAYEVSLQTIYWGSRPELVEIFNLAERGLIHAEHTAYTLDNALQAYHDLEAGKVKGRAVVIP